MGILADAWNKLKSYFSDKPIDNLVQSCPAPSDIEKLISSLHSLTSLPPEIVIPSNICKQMQGAMDKSIDADGNSKEHGGTFALDKNGKLALINEGGGGSDTFNPDVNVPSDYQYLGTFHTHPYGRNDGDLNGINTPFSGPDLATLDAFKEKISVVQSGNKKYVIVRTKESKEIDNDELRRQFDDSFRDELSKQVKAGHSYKTAFQNANEKVTGDILKEYNLGYYKGTNCDSIKRINP